MTEKRQTLKARILHTLEAMPCQTSIQLAESLQAKATSVKVTLHKLVKEEKVTRMREPRETKTLAGPQSLYRYKLKAE